MNKNQAITIQHVLIKFEDISFDEKTHEYCKTPLKSSKEPCHSYNKNYSYPPFSPTVEQTKKKIQKYKRFKIIIFKLLKE